MQVYTAMKILKALVRPAGVFLIVTALVLGIIAGRQYSFSTGKRMAAAKNLNQIGLTFRHGHNDVASPYQPKP